MSGQAVAKLTADTWAAARVGPAGVARGSYPWMSLTESGSKTGAFYLFDRGRSTQEI